MRKLLSNPTAAPYLCALLSLLFLPLWVAGCDAAPPADAAGAASGDRGGPSAEAASLRSLGLAHLENEQPAEAEKAYRKLVELTPEDPLPRANLAIALLRQQNTDAALAEIDKALKMAPGRSDLLAIRGEVLSWAGRGEEALAELERAMEAAPDDPEIVYQRYRTAATLDGEVAERARSEALARLVELRPENVVVLLEHGRRSIAAGDRTAASGAFLRLGELVWQAPSDAASQLLDQVTEALEAGDLEAARVPAQRLENVLKVSAMYQQSLRELWTGITGVPVQRFVAEPPPADFGNPVRVRFRGSLVDDTPTAGHALVAADLDGDGRPDVARLTAGDGGGLEVRLAAKGWAAAKTVPARGLGARPGLAVVDLDNDRHLDLLAYGAEGAVFFRNGGDGTFTDATGAFGLGGAGGGAVAVLDYDIEGDLDLAVAGSGMELYRNNLAGPLEAVGSRVFDAPETGGRATALVASDLDRDGDVDLLRAGGDGLRWLDNLRQGEMADRTADGGLASAGGARAVVAADLDNDGYPDLVTTGGGDGPLAFHRNREGRFSAWSVVAGLHPEPEYRALLAFDADNDGRLDLAAAGDPGDSGAPAVGVVGQRAGDRFSPIRVQDGPPAATALAAADLDGDGDLDLLAAGPAGLHRLDNEGGEANNWLAVRLQGLVQGSGKNNARGAGSVVEVRDGFAYQFREAPADGVVHFGLGKRQAADLMRVVWPNGVPQDRVDVAADQSVVEEQVLKGSCPFLYTWDGERVAFVTDLLWGSPIGLPVAAGVWAGADPSELVRVDGARPADGAYRLHVTEELWEAAFFDHVRLWVVDHPPAVEVASSLRILPGRQIPDEVRASRGVRPVAAAWDGGGREVTERVRRRDDVYADGYATGPYQGIAAEPWALTFDLGEAPEAPVRLHLDGWIFPTDASLNLALDQRPDVAQELPRLEVETDAGWSTLVPAGELGFPAGKTKTMVVDTPPLPPGASKLRVVTNLWLGWDRVAWTTRPADDEARVVARLLPARADLRYRGFSKLVRRAPNAPHAYDYARTTTASPWLPFPGRYTRYGDVAELLESADDRSVILGPGDEMVLEFPAADLPAPPEGWSRTVFLESHGWDKDADRNTWEPRHLEPLPFRAMSGYPYGPDEAFPDTPLHRRYREEWLTRVVEPASPLPESAPAGR